MKSEEPSAGTQWWSELDPATRQWLIDNNGDAVPEAVAREVAAAGGPSATLTDDDGGSGPGLYFPDKVIDWIEAAANDEGGAADKGGAANEKGGTSRLRRS